MLKPEASLDYSETLAQVAKYTPGKDKVLKKYVGGKWIVFGVKVESTI